MSAISATSKRALTALLPSLGAAAAVWIAIDAWPLWPLLLAAAAGWAILRNRRQLWAEFAADALGCTAVGLAIVCLAMAVVRLAGPAINADRLRAGEAFLITVHLRLSEALDKLTLPVTLAILIVLVAIAGILPKLDLVQRFGSLTGKASQASLVLMTILSFTFFSQKPLADLTAGDHDAVITQLKLLLRQEENTVGQFLAAQTLAKSFPLDDAARRNLQATLLAIQKDTTMHLRVGQRQIQGPSRLRHPVIDRMADEDAAAMAADPKAQSMLERGAATQAQAEPAVLGQFSRKPATVREYHDLHAAIDTESDRATSLAHARDQQMEAVKQAFGAVVGALSPELKGIAAEYAERLTDHLSDHLFEHLASLWHGGDLPQRIGALEDLVSDAGRLVLPTLDPAHNPEDRVEHVVQAERVRVTRRLNTGPHPTESDREARDETDLPHEAPRPEPHPMEIP